MSENQLAVQRSEISIGGMLQGVIEKGITADNMGALEKLMDLYERSEARQAEKDFASAFVELQANMPRVEAVSIVPGKDGKERYRFAPYEEIMKQVQPYLTTYGFTVAFDTRTDGPRITVSCTLMHKGGHSRKNEFAVQIGQGPPNCSPTQADGAAKTYAKRNALSDALNIVTGVDVDGGNDESVIGKTIDPMGAEILRKRVKEVGYSDGKFLTWVGVEKYEQIGLSRLEDIHDMLDRKEAKNKAV